MSNLLTLLWVIVIYLQIVYNNTMGLTYFEGNRQFGGDYMNKMKKRIALLLGLLLLMTSTITSYGATEVSFEQSEPRIVLTNESERIYSLEYNFDVTYTQTITGVDIVLVLDRSNSMIWPDPLTNKPLVQSVWDSVNQFIKDIYAAYPDSQIAVVSFGSNGSKSNLWTYYTSEAAALNEVKAIFDYVDLSKEYNVKYKDFKDNGYKFAWKNWVIWDGATNIKEGFQYATKTVTEEDRTITEDSTDTIVLFTDGVATQGGTSAQRNINNPTVHNSNTINAYNAGIAAQDYAQVITVGYFGGITNSSTVAIARDTLQRAQNAGFFEAANVSQLTGIFENISTNLGYLGTDAKVVETISKEFSVVQSSIKPEGYVVTQNSEGETVITWNLNVITDKSYTFAYDVKVKEDAYPTGTGDTLIPINKNATLFYKNLNKEDQVVELGVVKASIIPLQVQPTVKIDTTYSGTLGRFLVGDIIDIKSVLSYANPVPYDYITLEVRNFEKPLNTALSGSFEVIPLENQASWQTLISGLNTNINKTITSETATALSFNQEVQLRLKALKAGTYQFKHELDYTLVNGYGVNHTHTKEGIDNISLQIKNSLIDLTFVDDFGTFISGVELLGQDGIFASRTSDVLGKIKVEGIGSQTLTLVVPMPSGYRLGVGNSAGISVNAQSQIRIPINLNYTTPSYIDTIKLERLNIRNIYITNLLGEHQHQVAKPQDSVDIRIDFDTVRSLTGMRLILQDDYLPGNATFTLSQVRNTAGAVLSGFSMNGNTIQYSGSALPVGHYTVYGKITPPSNLGHDLDYDYKLDIPTISTLEPTDTLYLTRQITSTGLLVYLEDKVAPVIVSTLNQSKSSTNLHVYGVKITDLTKLVEYKVYEGEVTLLNRQTGTALALINEVNTISQVDFEFNARLTLVQEGSALKMKGKYTLYARDAFGNESIQLIDINKDIQQLKDQNII